MSAAQTTGREWSSYQRAIFDNVANDQGHAVVVARAGSGKTTTIVESFRHVPRRERVFMGAFNTSIADELKTRAPRGVEVRTLHSYGFAALRSALGNVRLDDRKVPKLVRERFEGSELGSAATRRQIERAVSLAKAFGATSGSEVDAMLDKAGVDVPAHRTDVIKAALWALDECRENTEAIDFDDMVWLPVVLGIKTPQFDRVFIDETQDFNRTMVELALRACVIGGRICAVGDDRQAIYGFRGADDRAIPSLLGRLQAKRLPLSVSYRCARSIVRVAREIVPDLEAAPHAEEGSVEEVRAAEMLEQADVGDFILSRTNAPLVSLFFKFVSRGYPVKVAGRDIGARIADRIRASRARTVEDLVAYMARWRAKECERLARQDPPGDSTLVVDMAECINVLADGAVSIAAVEARLADVFDDNADDGEKLILSTTHKAKGLERERVWVLRETYRRRPTTEEDNLWYVAVTRAKRELRIVTDLARAL